MAWKKVSNVAQYKGASPGRIWDNEVLRLPGMTEESAKAEADKDPRINFFFLMREGMYLEAEPGYEAKGEFSITGFGKVVPEAISQP